MRLKTGVSLHGLHYRMLYALSVVDELWLQVTGHDAVVTSGIEGKHKSRSLHRAGMAIDLRTRDLSRAEIDRLMELLKRDLDKMGYDVVDETLTRTPHLHIEYDPKIDEITPP